MTCKGQFTSTVQIRNDKFELKIFVIDSETDSLLGRTAESHMGLVQRVDNVLNSAFGELDDRPINCTPVKIILKEDAEPYSVATAIIIIIMIFISIALFHAKHAQLC